jgi:hypothetical protein
MQLQKEYPLPENWGKPEVFTESLSIGSLDLKMVGLSLASKTEIQATGSAVSPDFYPWDRAYFELLERAALLEIETKAPNESSNYLHIYNHMGSQISYAKFDSVFGQNLVQKNWRYSKSNGVAVHLNIREAIKNAGWELIERDRVLRFWYSKRSPKLISNLQSVIPKEIFEHYEINAYSFQEPSDAAENIWVVGIFGFPKYISEAPLIMGFGAGETQALALNKSIGETYQRLAFLWGEEKPTQLPKMLPCPGFHLEYYHCPASWAFLKDWLNGNLNSIILDFQPTHWRDLFFAHFTFLNKTSQIHLVKTISNTNIPLTFGNFNPKILFPLLGQSAIHPIA